MQITLHIAGKEYKVNLERPIDISIPLRFDGKNVTAWHVQQPQAQPVQSDSFIGEVARGGSVNFFDVYFNPHGHGTHTECVGHISYDKISIQQVLTRFFHIAQLITIQPIQQEKDTIITAELISSFCKALPQEVSALIIRTLPNDISKLTRNYSGTNPTYLSPEAMKLIAEKQHIKHLLVDFPSVDKENDGGELSSHRIFWENNITSSNPKTITEMVYVPSEIPDGYYFLQLMIASFELDATPSKPIIYPIK